VIEGWPWSPPASAASFKWSGRVSQEYRHVRMSSWASRCQSDETDVHKKVQRPGFRNRSPHHHLTAQPEAFKRLSLSGPDGVFATYLSLPKSPLISQRVCITAHQSLIYISSSQNEQKAAMIQRVGNLEPSLKRVKPRIFCWLKILWRPAYIQIGTRYPSTQWICMV
jgi:hypothetical protein